jgi:predicted anti-sigma-YlaC factor YlaD
VLNCRQFLGELCDYLDGDQGPGGCAEIERHLNVCGRCRIVCETARATVALYKRMSPVCAVPADVEARLMEAIAKRISGCA